MTNSDCVRSAQVIWRKPKRVMRIATAVACAVAFTALTPSAHAGEDTTTHAGEVATAHAGEVASTHAGEVTTAHAGEIVTSGPANPVFQASSIWKVTVTVARPITAYALNLGVTLPADTIDAIMRARASTRLTGKGHALNGIASYYWQDQMTATGERFDPSQLTAAHKTLPFGTRVRVTRLDTGSSVVVRINDRGPYKPGRVIDLSKRAAEEIGMTGMGLSKVKIDVLGK